MTTFEAQDIKEAAPIVGAMDSVLRTFLSERYELVALLGAGGFGRIFKAKHKELGQYRAIKVLHRQLILDTQIKKRFEAEALAISSLSHPNIVQIFDYSAEPQPFFVMEFLEGRTLADELCAHEKMSGTTVIDIGIAICSALSAAHKRGIVHRDIKPSNVIIDGPLGDANLKVMDFGLAKVIDGGGERLTNTGETLGSPQYMSPEQWTGKNIDARTDLYALGCMLYELLTGTAAFPGTAIAECMHAHLNYLPPAIVAFRRDLPEAESLDAILFKLLEKDVQRRYQTADQVVADLTNARSGKPLLHARSRRRSLSEWLRWKHKHLVRVSVATIASVLLIAVGLYFNRNLILNTAWSFNFSAGKKAFEANDLKQAEAHLDHSLKLLDQAGIKDRRLYWTLSSQAKVFKQNKKLPELIITQNRVNEITTNAHVASLLKEADDCYDKGNYSQVDKTLLQAIDEGRAMSQSNLPLAAALDKYGSFLNGSGRLVDGERMLKEALEIWQSWLEPDDLRVANTKEGLALNYMQTARYHESQQLLDEVLLVRTNQLGEFSEPVSQARANLGCLCYHQGDLVGSEDNFKKSIAICRAVFGEENISLLTRTMNLADLYRHERKYDQAEPLYVQALQISRKCYEKNHPQIARVLDHLGNCYYSEHKTQQAFGCIREALQIRESTLGPNHMQTKQTRAEFEKLSQQTRSS